MNKYISLIDETLNSGLPCESSTEAATSAGSAYSGAVQAGASNAVVEVDTRSMDTTKVFAVCYAETDGSATDTTWTESAIRITLPEVYALEVASGHTGTPNKLMKSWDQSTGYVVHDRGSNRLPQVIDQLLTYVGDLSNNMWISIVDVSLNLSLIHI